MNKKGFTVVELIASFALTMTISVFLFEVLIEVKDVFVETSLKSNIVEKIGIISKNIKLNVPKICDEDSCDGLITFNNVFGTVSVSGQSFDLPSGVKIASSSVSTHNCSSDTDNCYVTVQFELSHPNLTENYKYKAVYYYSLVSDDVQNGTLNFTGIIYRWSTAQWAANQDISGMTEGTDYVKKASDVVNMDSRGANYYLKHLVEGNIVTESYVCFKTDTEHCLRGGTDNGENPSNFYSSNVSVLTSQQSWFTGQGGSCTLQPSGSLSNCDGGVFYRVRARSDGFVNARDTDITYCRVYSDGLSDCGG